MQNPEPRTPAGIFYGWFVVAAAFALTFVGFGCTYSFSAFIDPFQHDFSASRGSVSLVFAFAGFLYFMVGSVSGPLADRFGSRRLALIGMILIGIGLAAASAARSLTDIYLAYGLGIGLGVGCSYVPAVGTVPRWFAKRRGFASGLASSGIGAGALVVPPIASFLIATAGWRETCLILGGFAVIIGGGMALLIENDPGQRGLAPDGEVAQADIASAKQTSGTSIREAVRSRRFLALYAACLACGFGVFVPFVHLVPYAVDHGITPATAAFLISAIGIGSTIGRFFIGGLADRLGRQFGLFAMFVGMALALLCWPLAAKFWPLAIFAFVFGTAYGGWVALLPAVIMDYFGGRNVSGLIGILYTSAGFGTLIGPSAAGFAFDLTHSYTLPILWSAFGNVIAALIIALASWGGRAKPAPKSEQ